MRQHSRPACQASTRHRHPVTVGPPPSPRAATQASHDRQAAPDASTADTAACLESCVAPASRQAHAPQSSPSHRHPVTVHPAPPRWSITELALGFGPGWPPTLDTPALARRADLTSRREFHQAHRSIFKGRPKGSRNTETALALAAHRALTTSCDCGALRDVHSLQSGRECQSCGPGYRPAECHHHQSKMAADLANGDRLYVAPATDYSYTFLVCGRSATLRAAAIAQTRSDRLDAAAALKRHR